MKIQSSSLTGGKVQHGGVLDGFHPSVLQAMVGQPWKADEGLWLDVEDPDPAVFALLGQWLHLSPQLITEHFAGYGNPHLYFQNCVLFRTERVFYHFETERCSSRNLCGILTGGVLITLHPPTLSRMVGHVFATMEARGAEVLCKGPSAVLPLLFDELIEDYKPVLEDWQNEIDQFEQDSLHNTSGQMLSEILRFKKLVTQLRHSFNKVYRDQRRLLIACPEAFLGAANRSQLGQSVNRLGRLLLEVEEIRQHTSSAYQVYAAALSLEMTRSSNHMNRIMERLAIVTSIFMPLTFIVGVYGMNIPDMPELHFQGFYFALWLVMLSIAGGLLYFFKKMRWY
ncbi:MAG: magnesium transporter CorA family protein [Inhella sp.]|jgi:magnesium transporter|uniref:magnesium transporter CorA family protein n=1 Tax=Inhella sp. TaxID=1921806 RepID=UPI0022BAC088|nr:CorA family divalent cation transporter [Inhella sp.]MCZ8235504.1 hypothetical protein [Inhella sp.]